jgi:hypothetical protein
VGDVVRIFEGAAVWIVPRFRFAGFVMIYTGYGEFPSRFLDPGPEGEISNRQVAGRAPPDTQAAAGVPVASPN